MMSLSSASRLQGIVPALVTPLDLSGRSLDRGAAQALVEFLIGHGVHGLFALGSTGECAYLALNVRKQMAETVISQANGRVPVVVHVGAAREDEVMDLACHAEAAGADAIAVVAPSFYALDSLALEQYFSRVAEAVELGIYLYNIPMNAKNRIETELFVRLAGRFPHFIGMKDSSMDLANYAGLLRSRQPHHTMMMGNDAEILSALTLGGDGAVSAGATAIPEPYIKLYEAFRAGDLEAARSWQAVCGLVKRTLTGLIPVAPQKQILAVRGLIKAVVASPLRSLTSGEARELLADYRLIQGHLKA